VALIPERLVNFKVYDSNGKELLGQTDVELPTFDPITESIGGAGMAGEYDSPVIGHFKSQTLKLKWRTLTKEGVKLFVPVRQAIALYGSVQFQDSTAGGLTTQKWRIECTGQVKMFTPGKLEPGKVMGVEMDFELALIRISADGQQLLELDKFNMIYKVNGVDYLAKIRQDTGGV
jgi:P2 family phage contractile tail tube protein